tara:strand:+ start:687 stop:2537 length:1851 start_codon:yes stop_codon:yes gene_type:complete
MNVTLPNGKVINGIPEGTPKDAIMQKAISSGLATQADFGVEVQPAQPVQPEQQQNTSFMEQVGSGISGAATIGSDIAGTAVGGVTALVDLINPFTDNDPVELIEQVKSKMRIEPTEGGEVALAQLGEALKPAEPLIKAVSDFKETAGQQGLDLTGSPAFATFVNIIPDIIAEASGFGAGKRIATRGAQEPAVKQAKTSAISDIAKAEELTGIQQLTSDVLPPETRLGKLMQSQGELVAGFQRKGQQAQRVGAVEKLANTYDVIEGTGFESQIVQGLKNSINESKKAIGKLYDESTAKLDQLGSVPLNKTKEFAQGIIERESKKGSLANQSVIDDMKTLIEAPDDLSFEMVKEIRSGVGANLEKVKRGAPVQGNTDTGLLKRVYGQLTSDMKNFANEADPELAKKWSKANSTVEEFATGTSKQGVKSIVKRGDATPEVVDSLLFSNKDSDLDFLSENLDKAGAQAAKQRVIQRAIGKSSIDGEDMNPNRFLTQLNKSSKQINKLFNADEKKAINALKKQLAKTRRAQDASVATPTGQQLVLPAAVAIPQMLLPGVVQAVIESKKVRNLLVRRNAAKTARQRTLIDGEMEMELNDLGLLGAGAVAATKTDTQEQEQAR